jgi:hypothetical protein
MLRQRQQQVYCNVVHDSGVLMMMMMMCMCMCMCYRTDNILDMPVEQLAKVRVELTLVAGYASYSSGRIAIPEHWKYCSLKPQPLL